MLGKSSGWSAIRRGVVTGAFAFAVFGMATIVFGQANTHQDRPFKATAEGSSTVAPGGPPGQFAAVSEGTVIGTHLGRGDYEIVSQQDWLRHVWFPDEETNDCAFVHGEEGVTLRAANGDEIHGTIDPNHSVICVTEQGGPPPLPDEEYLSTLYIHVEGGTGRFSDAEGWLFSRGTSTLDEVGPDGAIFDDESVILGDIDY